MMDRKWRFGCARVGVLLALGVAAAAGSAPASAANKDAVKFTQGHLTGKHAGKPFDFVLSRGTLKSLTVSGKAGVEARTLDLGFSSTDKKDTGGGSMVFIFSGNRLTGLVPVNLNVSTRSGGNSRMLAPHGTCKFDLKRADATGVEGAGTCTGEMWDLLKNKAVGSVTDLTLSVKP